MPAAAVAAAATVGSSLIGSSAAKSAAKTQANAASQAAQAQLQMFNTIRGDLTPYREFGGAALGPLAGLLGYGQFPATGGMGYGFAQPQSDWGAYLKANPDVLAEYTQEANRDAKSKANLMSLGISSPEDYAKWHYQTFGQSEGRSLPTIGGGAGGTGSPSQASMQAYLEAIPGYQFMRQQGTQQALNALTSKGLGGVSGALGKGIGRFVTGLADSTYGEQVNRLMAAAGMGQNAAVQTGNFGQNATTSANNANLYGAQSRAAGTTSSAGQLAGGLYQLGNQYSQPIGNWLSSTFGGGGGGWQGDPSGALASMPTAAQIAGSW